MITVEWCQKHNACYSLERLSILFPGPRSIIHVLTNQHGPWRHVPIRDRLWVALRYLPTRVWDKMYSKYNTYSLVRSSFVNDLSYKSYIFTDLTYYTPATQVCSDILEHLQMNVEVLKKLRNELPTKKIDERPYLEVFEDFHCPYCFDGSLSYNAHLLLQELGYEHQN